MGMARYFGSRAYKLADAFKGCLNSGVVQGVVRKVGANARDHVFSIAGDDALSLISGTKELSETKTILAVSITHSVARQVSLVNGSSI